MKPENPLSLHDLQLLDRYYAGLCDVYEADAARRLIEQSWHEQLFAAAIRPALEGSQQVPAPDEIHRRFEVLRAELVVRDEPASKTGRDDMARGMSRRGVSRERPWWGIRSTSIVSRSGLYGVAAVVAVVCIALASWRVSAYVATTHTPTSMVTYVTARGERGTIMLPDSSKVVLNVASRLEVPTDYERGNRRVRLVGEALFQVAHHDGTPFTVIAGSSVTRVLGTSFLVRRYATDSMATIAVRAGKVVVQANVQAVPASRKSVPAHARSAATSVILTAMQQVAVGSQVRTSVQRADLMQFGFATGVLALNGVPLPAAIEELDRWYDADIRLGDPSLTSREITGEFTAGSLTDLSEVLELTFGVRVVRNGRVLTLYPRG